MPYSVPPLPYDYAALEPHIDEQTMRIHHDKHHQAYVDKVNGALEGTRVGRQADRGRHSRPPADPRGQARRRAQQRRRAPQPHALLELHEPDGGGAPSGDLASAIEAKFGSFDDFKAGVQGRRHQPVRLGLGLARQGRATASRSSRRPTRTTRVIQRHGAAAGRRRLGARLLPQVPESPARLPRRVVERRRLGGRRAALRRVTNRGARARGRAVAPARALTPCGLCERMIVLFPPRRPAWRQQGHRSITRPRLRLKRKPNCRSTSRASTSTSS